MFEHYMLYILLGSIITFTILVSLIIYYILTFCRDNNESEESIEVSEHNGNSF